ncbi:hypothetical protein Arub01_52440 [Actinomadura rubrobrunea]|uniref:Uncharacterized protein n=1 Tax=Actinomadura rubrobrunea TaxID=115335 RepID=A0A9W6Q1F0_9ACTN|nr:hypothetical protein [Actinomadura rubrobrunea]GLW67001.1 hypothetical protein Arub01_52440 [Actinomadura rubrobrunea]
MTRTAAAPQPRRGPACLLVALFLVAGLVSSYGLGHGAPLRVCTQHAVSVPSAVADVIAADLPPKAHALHPEAASSATTSKAPVDLPPLGPAHACLCLAVLISLLAIALAVGRRRRRALRADRAPRVLVPSATGPPLTPSLASLQVLRL